MHDIGPLESSSDKRFIEYYSEASLSQRHVERFIRIRAVILAALGHDRPEHLDVLDVGCGAGTECRIWAEGGDRVFGVDINAALIELGKARAERAGLDIRFTIGSATAIPLADRSVDVCIAPELLEHVADWQSCLEEFHRVLRPAGVLYISTTNKLCPKQEEFDLPFYSWYPPFLKHYYERLALTTRPEIVQYAKYPAVNWFSFYSLRKYLAARGYRCLDRFDTLDGRNSRLRRYVQKSVAMMPMLRFIGHVMTPFTHVVALKSRAS